MLFMTTWRMHSGRIGDAYQAFAALPAGDPIADGGPNIKIIGRWHDMAGGTGVAIFETTDAAAIEAYMINWNPMMDLQTTPVVMDEEAKSIARAHWGRTQQAA